MMFPLNGFVNLKNSEVTSYLRLKQDFIKFLQDNGYLLYANFDSDYVIIFDWRGNDLGRMTFKQLARRVKI